MLRHHWPVQGRDATWNAMIARCQTSTQGRRNALRKFRMRWGIRYTRGVLGSTLTPSTQLRRVVAEFPRGVVFWSIFGAPNLGPFSVPGFGSLRRNPSYGSQIGGRFSAPNVSPPEGPQYLQ